MRNLKKLLAVIVAVCVLATITVPAFAADASLTDGEKLGIIGVMKGTSGVVDDTYLSAGTQRYQAAVIYLRLLGLEEEAYAGEYEENYADATDVKSANMQKALGYLYANRDVLPGWQGVGGGKFEPTKPATAQMIYKVLLEALGYKQGVDFEWAETLDFAAEVGLTKIADVGELTNADLATAIVEALGTKIKGEDKTLIEKLVEDGIVDEADAVEAGLVEAAPAALEVAGVSATNLRELVVTFNRAPVEDEAKKASNYKVEGNAPDSVSLSEDKLTATLLMSVANKMGNYAADITLEIAKAVGFEADVKIDNIAVKDVTVPTAVSAEATGPRTIKVTFSEPLEQGTATTSQVVSAFKLDKGTVALDTTVASYSGRTISLRTLADLKEGSHTLEIVKDSALKDSAGYTVAPVTLSFTYAKDTTPISVAVEESTETTVKIKFNKAVDPSTVINANVYFRHTYNTTTNQVVGNASGAVTNAGDDQTFTIDFGSGKPFPPGTTNLYIKYEGSHKIKDYYGNELAETILSVTTTADLTKPVVEKVEFKDATTLEVTFSEKVGSGATTVGNYTLKDSAGDAITVSAANFKADSGDKVVVLTTATMNGGSYTLAVKDVKDVSIAQNELDDVTVSFTAVDKVAPTVSSVKQIGGKKVKITYSEAMDPATAGDKTYYMLNGAALGSDDTVEMADSNKAVIITFKNDLPATPGNITIARVKDAAGNWKELFSETISIVDLAPLTPAAVEMISKTTIKMKFDDEVISGAVAADFQVSKDGGSTWLGIVGLSTTVTDGDTYIEISISDNDKINNTIGTGVQVRTSGGAVTTGAKNAYDNTLQFTVTSVSDKIAPEIAAATTADTGTANSKIDRINVDFSEAMYMPSIQDSDFTVEGYEVTAIEFVDADTIRIVVKEKDAADGDATPKVKVVGEVEDSARNKATNLEKTPTDGI